MFWSRGRRQARRQKVLDELLGLEPAERRQRLQQAVVAGDVRPGEVDQALRLVARLDAVRIMTLPIADGVTRRAEIGAEPVGQSAPVGEPMPSWLAAEPLPLDAVESAARLIAGSRANRRSSRTQVRLAGPRFDAGPQFDAGPASATTSVSARTQPASSESRPEEREPDISWLRP